MYLVTGYKNFLTKKELQIKMILSVQRSVVESFSFNRKNVSSVHVPDVGQCLVAKDVSKAVGHNDDGNARRAVQTHIPGSTGCV